MAKKNSAIIISSDADFKVKNEEILADAHFKVGHCIPTKDWHLTCIRSDTDCLLIDNISNNFKYAPLIQYLKKIEAQLFLINIGPGKPRVLKNPYHIFTFDGTTNVMNLAEFLKSADKLIRNNRDKLDLAGMLLHDARSPLNSLIGYIDLLLNDTFGRIDNGQRKILEKAINLGDATLEMLEDLSEVMKSSQHSILLQKQKFNIRTVLDSILVGIWVKSDNKNIKITKRVSPEIEEIYGDDYQIQRVITNLLNNAIKYCPNNSHINIQMAIEEDCFLKVTVSDNGSGVPEEHLNKLFNKYFRIREKEKIQKGYGLGLYICRVIVKSHGGKIWASNNEQGGLSIQFTLPLSE